MKNLINKFLVALLIFTATIGLTACKQNPPPNITATDIQNLIILIGDGMGQNHIDNAKTYFELGTQTFESEYITNIDTNSLSIGPTDSAAAATALATGVSVKNGRISHDGTNSLKNIMEYASDHNMLTGIITNDNLFGATPAAFSAHSKDRGNTTEIVANQSTSPLDLMIGQYSEEYYNQESLFTSNGFTMCNDEETLYTIPNTQKVVANLNNVYSIYNPNKSNTIDMLDLVRYAVDYLDNENGFVLMVECAYIDKFSHSNDIIPALSEVRTLFDIANFACDYITNNPDTALIITSDHETGGLKKTSEKSKINNNLYTTGSHTSSDVRLYSKGIKLDSTDNLKNTVVFNMSYSIVSN